MKRKPGTVTHRRNSGSFGFGVRALCGAKDGTMSSNPKNVNCALCLEHIKRFREAAQRRSERTAL